jgi:hypothetical protein
VSSLARRRAILASLVSQSLAAGPWEAPAGAALLLPVDGAPPSAEASADALLPMSPASPHDALPATPRSTHSQRVEPKAQGAHAQPATAAHQKQPLFSRFSASEAMKVMTSGAAASAKPAMPTAPEFAAVADAPTPLVATPPSAAAAAQARTPSTEPDTPLPLSPSRRVNGNTKLPHAQQQQQQQRTPERPAGKRALSHKPRASFTPNVNPNYVPPVAGETPQSVPPASSPYGKRTRRSSGDVAGAEAGGGADAPLEPPRLSGLPVESSIDNAAGEDPAGGLAAPAMATSPVMPRRCLSGSASGGRLHDASAPQEADRLRRSLMSINPLTLSCGAGGTVTCDGAPCQALALAPHRCALVIQ